MLNMMNSQANNTPVKIGGFLVKPSHNQLIHDDQVTDLEPLAMAMLMLLAEQPGRVISAEELFEKLWQGKVVSDSALHRIVRQLRKALNDSASSPQYIRTIRKSGYALISPVEIIPAPTEKRQVNKLLAFATIVVTFIIALVFWFNWTPTTYQLKDTRLLTGLPGVERSPVIWQQQNSVIFTYQPPGELYNNILLRPINKSSYRNLTDDYWHYSNLTISHDGKYLAFARRGVSDCSIHYVNLNNRAMPPVQLAQCRFEAPNHLAWSSDSNQLLFERSKGPYSNSQIMVVDRHNLSVEPLIKTQDAANDYYQSVEPQGSRIAFVRSVGDDSQIRLFDLNSKSDTLLYQWQQSAIITGLIWRKDQQQLLVSTSEGLKLLSLEGQISTINGNSVAVNELPAINNENTLVFASTDHSSQLAEYPLPTPFDQTIKEHDQGQIRSLSSKSEYDGQYGQTPQTLVFLSNRESQHYRLWLEQDGVARLLYDKPVIGSPQWSNDYSKIAFLTQDYQLAILSMKDSSLSFPQTGLNKVGRVAWGQSKEVIYISGLINGVHQIFKLQLADNQVTQLTQEGGFLPQPSKDGRYLYYNRFDQSGLWRLTLADNRHELIIPGFHKMNYSTWQAFDQGVYYIRDANATRGLFYYDFAKQQQKQLIDNKEFFRFNVAKDQRKVLITEKKALIGDLHISTLMVAP